MKKTVEGKKEEPISTQPYLSTSPLKNAERLVPFSQIILALSINCSSLIANIPPSPAIMFFVSWNEKAAKCPIEPNAFLIPSFQIKTYGNRQYKSYTSVNDFSNLCLCYQDGSVFINKINKKFIRYSIDVGGYDTLISYDNGNLNIELSFNAIDSSIVTEEWNTIFNKISQKSIKLSIPLDNGFTVDDVIKYKNDINMLHIILSNNLVYKSRIV